MITKELVIIGGGPAGLAAAIEAKKHGAKDILLIERDSGLGGILQQCIHNGFGLHVFKEELTGPEYADRFIKELEEIGIEVLLDTMVIDLTEDKQIIAVSHKKGLLQIKADAVILTMGCRERTRGAINIPGYRPAGIFTAGTAQRFVNIEGYMPGKEIVILGSGDIGLIMARRFTLEGAKVKCVAEIMPYSNGLTRNIVQCLEDFDIPLLLSHTVTYIHGRNRVEGVTIAQVDDKLNPIPSTEKFISCDTLLLSVGLIPENELSKMADIQIDNVTGGPVVNQRMETSVPGIFACGNVVHVHDLVDFVTMESRLAGRGAVNYLKNKMPQQKFIKVSPGSDIRYVVPQLIDAENILDEKQNFFMRSTRPMEKARLFIESEDGLIRAKVLQHIKPSEMINIELKKEELANKDIKTLKFSLQEEGVDNGN
ncbi:FAD-dependent pyridine nucleotide-disulfide oxidoreductase [Tepidanaerobacter acetatoxydans Re1]|jgi:NADPH-dependent 2,4-dienoyl-CoA reductase/sulfur reductase-like enzyme|uniref:FAD-dependent pyridine nucleotide-disulfide oxidoreductase n=1 Tax=Tepidanaerobacter acetatoxydans (strain DSM 21804 / JCM 16047 / Re1) TaxID=1209989 RepID=F4LVR4_TEPAE|nr:MULTISPECIES: FAD-dependent oxidoreductase [Tepidanaerobacter]AEE90761.1 FAD-dependent pyridine nucleotide-disulfide oxidoreductase [Tepidanaerobacter acetatoxydans Re1]CCP25315.1 FAD-dependent pyridine nucleotide-disulfide oxidoreductase [Tepidanaerobacter acetatoxydans Re1]